MQLAGQMRMANMWRPPEPSPASKRLIKVGDQVIDIFQSNGEAHQAVRDTHKRAHVFAQVIVECRSDRNNKRAGISKTGCLNRQLKSVDSGDHEIKIADLEA